MAKTISLIDESTYDSKIDGIIGLWFTMAIAQRDEAADKLMKRLNDEVDAETAAHPDSDFDYPKDAQDRIARMAKRMNLPT